MGLRINDTIPDLTVETDQGSFSLHDWIGDSWAILFSHPKDFTPVCTTEFGAVAQLADEWADQPPMERQAENTRSAPPSSPDSQQPPQREVFGRNAGKMRKPRAPQPSIGPWGKSGKGKSPKGPWE